LLVRYQEAKIRKIKNPVSSDFVKTIKKVTQNINSDGLRTFEFILPIFSNVGFSAL